MKQIKSTLIFHFQSKYRDNNYVDHIHALKQIANHIYLNKDYYNKKYVYYFKDDNDYVLEPENIKTHLIEEYRSRARNDMKSIARILNIETNESEGAEDIRKKVINCIIKDKLSKIKH